MSSDRTSMYDKHLNGMVWYGKCRFSASSQKSLMRWKWRVLPPNHQTGKTLAEWLVISLGRCYSFSTLVQCIFGYWPDAIVHFANVCNSAVCEPFAYADSICDYGLIIIIDTYLWCMHACHTNNILHRAMKTPCSGFFADIKLCRCLELLVMDQFSGHISTVVHTQSTSIVAVQFISFQFHV